MVFLEFLGIPGSGKSTIRNLLLNEAKKGNFRFPCVGSSEAFSRAARDVMGKAFGTILDVVPGSIAVPLMKRTKTYKAFYSEMQRKFLARYGQALGVFFQSPQFRDMSQEDREGVIGGFLATGTFFQGIQGGLSFKEVVVFDEGFVQKTMMFVSTRDYHPESQGVVKEFLEYTPKPDVIIYCKADLNVCRERMLLRPKKLIRRLKGANPMEVESFLKNSETQMGNLVNVIRNENKIKLIEIDNNGSPENSVKTLASIFGEIGVGVT